jgi:hypothetical protein
MPTTTMMIMINIFSSSFIRYERSDVRICVEALVPDEDHDDEHHQPGGDVAREEMVYVAKRLHFLTSADVL